MKLLLFSISLFGGLLAATTISNVSIHPSAESARIAWTTDERSDHAVSYGRTLAYGKSVQEGSQLYTHAIPIAGLSPGTLYNVKICSTSTSTTCTGNLTFSTLPGDGEPVPTLPRAVDTAVYSKTTTALTASTCDDIQPLINKAAAGDPNMNFDISIKETLTCVGRWILPDRPSGFGWITIRSGSKNIPPEGTRAELVDATEMPTLISNRVEAWPLPSQPFTCRLGDLWWNQYGNSPMLYKCVSTSPVRYELVPFVGTGPNLPVNCKDGEWFYKSDSANHNDRAHWCVSPNVWRQITFTWANYDTFAALVASQYAKRYDIIGLRLQPIKMPASWVSTLHQTERTSGSYSGCLAATYPTNDRIVFDRMILDGLGYPNRTLYGFCFWDGSNMVIKNSFFNEINRSVPESSGLETAQAGIFMLAGPGPALIENNYFKNNIGCTIFASDDLGSNTTVPSDVTVRRNIFYEDPRYNAFGLNSNGQHHWRRNIIELKRGERWLFEGNTLDGGWPSTTRGSSLSFTPRQGGTQVLDNSIRISNITIRSNWFNNAPHPIAFVGYNDSFDANTLPTEHILIENNLFTTSNTPQTPGWPYGRMSEGNVIIAFNGLRKFQIKNNTVYNAHGIYDADLLWTLGGCCVNSDLSVKANLLYPSGGSSGGISSGEQGLNDMWRNENGTTWEVTGNVFVKRPYTKPIAGNTFLDNDLGLPWHTSILTDWRFSSGSVYNGVGHDGSRLSRDMGRLSNVRVSTLGGGALSVSYSAPDSEKCMVRYSSDPRLRNATYLPDLGGQLDRMIQFSVSTPLVPQFIQVMCAQRSATLLATPK